MSEQNGEHYIDAVLLLHAIWNSRLTENQDEEKIIREHGQFMPNIVLKRQSGQNEVWPRKWTTAYDL